MAKKTLEIIVDFYYNIEMRIEAGNYRKAYVGLVDKITFQLATRGRQCSSF